MELDQTASQEDFTELCKAIRGRWIGVWMLPVDLPGIGAKGEKTTWHADFRPIADGSASLGTFYLGDATITELDTYNPVTRQIDCREAQSGGTVWNSILYKQDGNWRKEGAGSHPDGTKTELSGTINFSGDGETFTSSGTLTAEGGHPQEIEIRFRRVGR
jgi:hypothetical protein